MSVWRYGKKRRMLPSRLAFIGITCLVIATIGVALYTYVQGVRGGAIEEPPPATRKITAQELNGYIVPPTFSRYIRIEKINVQARVVSVGVLPDKRMQSPSNVFDVGWFTKSALPDTEGAVVMNGHISSEKTKGVFYRLKDLKQGDVITLERGDEKKIRYQVVTTETTDVNNVDMVKIQKPIEGKKGLNIISCTGRVIKGTREFDKRIVVFTKQIE